MYRCLNYDCGEIRLESVVLTDVLVNPFASGLATWREQNNRTFVTQDKIGFHEGR